MEDFVGLYHGTPNDNDLFVNDIVESVFGTNLRLLHEKFLQEQVSRVLKRKWFLTMNCCMRKH